MVAFALLVAGGVNWGLVGLAGERLNVVALVFDPLGLTQVVYLLVGASAVYIAATHMKDCKMCASKK